MDDYRFDAFVRVFASMPWRRRALPAAGAAVAGLLGDLGRQEAAAIRGCRNDGKRCRRGRQCCSGLCRGRKRKACRPAPDQGTCTVLKDVCRHVDPPDPAHRCDDLSDQSCYCFVTTRGRAFCGSSTLLLEDCTKDSDCDAVSGPGSACNPGRQAANPVCAQPFCIPPCPTPASPGR